MRGSGGDICAYKEAESVELPRQTLLDTWYIPWPQNQSPHQPVEAKQGAQQVAERSKFVVAKADRAGETAAVIRAEAARLIFEATKGAAVIRVDGLRRIEAWREITAMLAKNLKVTYLPGDEGNGILWGLVVGESVMRMKRVPLVL
ncbi:hypothetical protein Vadar_002609 [Vaccinium darrowii]|uniref:Uncharacterized protein n=1 Tax=Vaccinium darrowii TaxID=229202 RepID=A0ACB7XFB0_9ERIC|nr:hypothetical protein Vadar_002609 [Vaccinium darrowii]